MNIGTMNTVPRINATKNLFSMRRANRAIFDTRFKFLIASEFECRLQPAKMVFI